MTVYGINSTERDRSYGWADIQPTRHCDPFLLYSLRAWKMVAFLADLREDGKIPQEDVNVAISNAELLQKIYEDKIECSCNPRDDNCIVCGSLARLLATEVEYGR